MGIFDSKSEEQEEDSGNTYEIDWKCDNCGNVETHEIPCKTPARDFLKIADCEECGCKVLDVAGRDFREKKDLGDDEDDN